MADSNRQETGSSLMVIGWLMLLFALVVVFFHSAAGGIGRSVIDTTAIVLVIGGIGMNAVGYRIRGRAR
jgi:cytochrome c biogenesis protein CcdA